MHTDILLSVPKFVFVYTHVFSIDIGVFLCGIAANETVKIRFSSEWESCFVDKVLFLILWSVGWMPHYS